MKDPKLSESGLYRILDKLPEETLWNWLKRKNPTVIVWYWFIQNFKWPSLLTIVGVLLWAVNLQGRVTILERVVLVEPEALAKRVKALEDNWDYARCILFALPCPEVKPPLNVLPPRPQPSSPIDPSHSLQR